MHSPTLLLPLSLYLFLATSVSPSTSLAIASAASPIAAHAKHHINARRPVNPPEQPQEAPPVSIPEPQSTTNQDEFERKGDEEAHEFDTGVPATPGEGERQAETHPPPIDPDPKQDHQQAKEEQPQPQEPPNPPETKPDEAQKPLAPKKKPKKSLYTWPLLKTDILDCCPKYAYNCADRKAICHDGQRAEV